MRKYILCFLLLLAPMVYAEEIQKPEMVKAQKQIRELSDTGKYKEAETMAVQLVLQNPGEVDPQVLLAYIYFQVKDFRSSQAVLQNAQKLHPDDKDIPELLDLVNASLSKQAGNQGLPNNPVVPVIIAMTNNDAQEQAKKAAEAKAKEAQAQAQAQAEAKKKVQAQQAQAESEVKKPQNVSAGQEQPEKKKETPEQRTASVISPANLQATNIINAVASPYNEKYGYNQLGINQQSIYGTSPDGYWDYSTLYYTRKVDGGTVIGYLNYASRFGFKGIQGAAEAIMSVNDKFYVDLNLAYATNQNLFPNWTVGVEGYVSLMKDLQVSLGDLYRGITPSYFNTWTGSIQKYMGDYLLIFRPYIYLPDSGTNSALYTGTVKRYFDDSDHSLTLTVGYGITPDLADLTTLNYIVVKDRSAALTYEFPVWDHRFVVDLGLSYENQRFPSGFTRQLSGADFAIRARF